MYLFDKFVQQWDFTKSMTKYVDFLHFIAYKYNLNSEKVINDFNEFIKEEETKSTSVKKIFRTTNYLKFDKLIFLHNLSLLLETIEEDGLNVENLKKQLKAIVSTYRPSN